MPHQFGDRVQITAPGRHDGKTGSVLAPVVQGGTPGFEVEVDDEGPFFFLPEEIGPIPRRDVLTEDAVTVLHGRLTGVLTAEQLHAAASVLDTLAHSRADLDRRLDVLAALRASGQDTDVLDAAHAELRAILAAARKLHPVLATLAELPPGGRRPST